MGSSANLGRVAEVLQNGVDRERLGNGVYGTIGRDFVTADGVRVMIVAINERQWQGLVRALGLQSGLAALEAALGVSFTGDDGVRFRNRDAIYRLIDVAISALPHAELAEKLDKDGVTHGPYKTMPEAVADPRLVGANPMFAPVANNPSGFAYPAAGAFATFPGLDRLPPAPAPVLGADTGGVLARHLALDPEAIARLIEVGIVGTPA
jgi:2-methylfumaryl-CoA isomerase